MLNLKHIIVNSAESGAAAVFVHYALPPEARYGVAIEQAFAATRWVAEHGKEIDVDAEARKQIYASPLCK